MEKKSLDIPFLYRLGCILDHRFRWNVFRTIVSWICNYLRYEYNSYLKNFDSKLDGFLSCMRTCIAKWQPTQKN